MDDVELGWLLRSYYRRQKFQAELLANTVVEALAKAMGAGESTSAPTAPARQRLPARSPAAPAAPDRRVVPAHEFFTIIAER